VCARVCVSEYLSVEVGQTGRRAETAVVARKVGRPAHRDGAGRSGTGSQGSTHSARCTPAAPLTYAAHSSPAAMKRSTSLSWLLDRRTPWLAWWQELILNWVSSWGSVGTLTVVSAGGEDYTAWELPTDLELKRAELEELVQ
jgi:hypothetical protein